MTARIGLFAVVAVLVLVALWHPAPRPAPLPAEPALASDPAMGARRTPRAIRPRIADAVVYVAGAVRHPGLYRVTDGERAADAVAKAGGLATIADAGGVNLAERVADGDEIYVPAAGEAAAPGRARAGSHPRRSTRSHRRSAHASLEVAPASVDINAAAANELANVPGIGAAIAARIVEMRAVDGSFTSLDQLLDVAGMTQTRLERARPYLRSP
jgi:competence protein ComEA